MDEISTDYPLTARQSLFWLDEQLYRGVPYNHVVLTASLVGDLDVSRFVRAFRATVQGFDQFRTVIFVRNGEPRQRFRDDFEPELACFDLRGAERTVDEWVRAHCAVPFDFGNSLFEAALIRVGEYEHVFYLCQHHIITDGRWIALFLYDLGKHYRGESVSAHPSYARYIEFEQAYRRSPRAERDAEYYESKSNGGALRFYGRP